MPHLTQPGQYECANGYLKGGGDSVVLVGERMEEEEEADELRF